MNPSKNNTQTTINQESLPPIQNFFEQCPNSTVPVNSTQNPVPQEYGYYLSNDNEQINNSGLTRASIHNPEGIHVNPTNTNEGPGDLSSTVFVQQYNTTTSKKIGIKSQPRALYHPRTEKESGKMAHYIRCKEGDASEYPAIYVFPNWATESNKNYIEVALVDIDNEFHPYIIKSNQGNSSDGQPLVTRGTDKTTNMLFFRLTDEDFNEESKVFMIELIKPKQDETITKTLIRERQLEKSKLRFTRTFYDQNGNYHRDEATTVYSDVMTEHYVDLAVKHMAPQVGPMSSNYLVNIVFKSLKGDDKKKLSFEVFEQATGCTHKITNFDSTGSTVHISMPTFSTLLMKEALANVIVYYDGEQIYESSYLYYGDLDQKLCYYNINKPTEADSDSMTSNSSNGSTQSLVNNSSLLSTGSKTKSVKNSKKRQHED